MPLSAIVFKRWNKSCFENDLLRFNRRIHSLQELAQPRVRHHIPFIHSHIQTRFPLIEAPVLQLEALAALV